MSSHTSGSATALFRSLKKKDTSYLSLEEVPDILEIDSETIPIDAASQLWRGNTLSAPVWDTKLGDYVGMFDVRDMISAVIVANEHVVEGVHRNEYAAIISQKAGLSTCLASYNPLSACNHETSLEEVCSLLIKSRCGYLIIKSHDSIRFTNAKMIDRLHLVEFMHDRASSEDLLETLDEAGLDYRKPVITVKSHETAIKTFKVMESKGLYGIAIVDKDDGSLINYTSARDIWLVTTERCQTYMNLEILTYLSKIRQLTVKSNGKASFPSCHVHHTATISQVIKKLIKTKYHRIFVVDEERVPVGVISATDILHFVLTKRNKSDIVEVEYSVAKTEAKKIMESQAEFEALPPSEPRVSFSLDLDVE